MVEDIVQKIKKLKEKRKAIILAHNYQLPEIQDIADSIGDSLNLSLEASKTKAEVIVFCGVYFMAETAKILSPEKTVIIPDKYAGCPMADMITAKQLELLKKQYPKAKVLCYVNTSAEVKAISDYCCTSANAIKIVNGPLKDIDEVIFVPDKYLADYVASCTKKEFICWQGYCPVHIKIKEEDIIEKKKLYPKAEVIVHPECIPEVIKLADKVFSTEGMCRYVKNSKAKEFIIGTEVGIIYRLSKENPDKLFYPANQEAICEDMKKITLSKVLVALEELKYEVVLKEDIIMKAKNSIQKMLEASKQD